MKDTSHNGNCPAGVDPYYSTWSPSRPRPLEWLERHFSYDAKLEAWYLKIDEDCTQFIEMQDGKHVVCCMSAAHGACYEVAMWSIRSAMEQVIQNHHLNYYDQLN